jgi:DNA polymerase-3 subunit chi
MRVDFYILEATDPAERMSFACRLTEKAYSLNNQVYAHTESAADAARLDELLWTFRQGSFVPHEQVAADSENRAPVLIGTGEQHKTAGDLLINLDKQCPAFASGFARVVEIIGGDEASVQAGRQRFKEYRDMGITPETHRIKA